MFSILSAAVGRTHEATGLKQVQHLCGSLARSWLCDPHPQTRLVLNHFAGGPISSSVLLLLPERKMPIEHGPRCVSGRKNKTESITFVSDKTSQPAADLSTENVIDVSL